MLGHASAATPLDVYADLFECDLDAVAESVSKLCRLGGCEGTPGLKTSLPPNKESHVRDG
jgi:hypothetical protein